MNTNNSNANIFSHTSKTKKENANTIYISEKVDKLDELVEAVNILTINDAKYYESNTATASDAQGGIVRNPETVAHNSNRNETVTHTSNRNFEPKSLINWTIPIFPPVMNPEIDQGVAPIVLTPHLLFASATK